MNNEERLCHFMRVHEQLPASSAENDRKDYQLGRTELLANVDRDGVNEQVANMRAFVHYWLPRATSVTVLVIDGIHRMWCYKNALCGRVPSCKSDTTFNRNLKDYVRGYAKSINPHFESNDDHSFNKLSTPTKVYAIRDYDDTTLDDLRNISETAQKAAENARPHGKLDLLAMAVEELHKSITPEQMLVSSYSSFDRLLSYSIKDSSLSKTHKGDATWDHIEKSFKPLFENDDTIEHGGYHNDELNQYDPFMKWMKKYMDNYRGNGNYFEEIIDIYIKRWAIMVLIKIRAALTKVECRSHLVMGIYRNQSSHKLSELTLADYLALFEVKSAKTEEKSNKSKSSSQDAKDPFMITRTTKKGKDILVKFQGFPFKHESCLLVNNKRTKKTASIISESSHLNLDCGTEKAKHWTSWGRELVCLLIWSCLSDRAKELICNLRKAKNSQEEQISTLDDIHEARFLGLIVQTIASSSFHSSNFWSRFSKLSGKEFKHNIVTADARQIFITNNTLIEVTEFFIIQGMRPTMKPWCENMIFADQKDIKQKPSKADILTAKEAYPYLDIDSTGRATDYYSVLVIFFTLFLKDNGLKRVNDSHWDDEAVINATKRSLNSLLSSTSSDNDILSFVAMMTDCTVGGKETFNPRLDPKDYPDHLTPFLPIKQDTRYSGADITDNKAFTCFIEGFENFGGQHADASWLTILGQPEPKSSKPKPISNKRKTSQTVHSTQKKKNTNSVRVPILFCILKQTMFVPSLLSCSNPLPGPSQFHSAGTITRKSAFTVRVRESNN